MRPIFAGLLGVALTLGGALQASAQDTTVRASDDMTAQTTPGWSFTPALGYAGTWDDNVLVRGKGDATVSDYMSLVNPRGDINYSGHRGQLTGTYDGAFVLYRDVNSLDSYDQHASLFAKRMITQHVSLFVNDSAAAVPTTQLQEFVGVPFVRTGSRLEAVHGGVEAAFTKRTSIVASYNFLLIDFDRDPSLGFVLLGGHSQGGTFSLRHAISARTTLTADYDIQRANIISGATFTVQNSWAGAEKKLSESTRVFGALGVSHLAATTTSDARTGPAWRAGLSHQFRTASFDAVYVRLYVPVFGFGGTQQNEEVTSRLQLPLGRRLYTQSSVSLRRNNPLTPGELSLRSLWLQASVGYAVQPWMRIEAFYGGTRQTSTLPGGDLSRNLVGFQIITAKPMRVR